MFTRVTQRELGAGHGLDQCGCGMTALVVIGVVAVAVVVVVLLVAVATRRSRDTASEVTAPPAVALGPAVAAFAEAAYTVESETDARYVGALEGLRRDPHNAASQIEAAYQSLDPEQIRARESVLLAAAALAHRSILPLLVQVAHEPLRRSISREGSRAEEESVLKLIALQGIEAIARSGDDDAAEALVALAASPDRAVQAEAVVALKYAEGHRQRYEELAKTLPHDRLYLLDLMRADVHDVPQVEDPRRHLVGGSTTVDARPNLASGERRHELDARRTRPPRAANGN